MSIVFILGAILGAITFIWSVLGFIVYIWIYIGVAAMLTITFKAFAMIWKKCCGREMPARDYGGIVIAPSLFVLVFIWIGLTMVNLYSGTGYWKSFELVLTERHWNTYVAYMLASYRAKFIFFTMLF